LPPGHAKSDAIGSNDLSGGTLSNIVFPGESRLDLCGLDYEVRASMARLRPNETYECDDDRFDFRKAARRAAVLHRVSHLASWRKSKIGWGTTMKS
jgi:hypothetical protein